MNTDVTRCAVTLCALAAIAGCKEDKTSPTQDGGEPSTLSREQLMNPETCKDCHPNHYREWASSMHAYAIDDPIFIAMNARGQREAKLGEFCVNCHAPLAVREGYAKDGNLDEIPKPLRGVTCYFCHNVESVNGTHNNPIKLANDTTMRGGLHDARRPSAHGVEYSPFLDGARIQESSKMCGSCHDIVTPAGVHLERTYAEWKESLFSHGAGAASCSSCHMDGRPGIAADDLNVRVPARRVHSHLFPGVDLALTPFRDEEIQRKNIECALRDAVRVSLCPNPDGRFQVLLETNAGHRLPTGASQDRRMWLEVIAYDADGKPTFESGVVADGDVVDKPQGTPGHDPNLWLLSDKIFDADGNEAHMFWDAAPSETYPEGYHSATLPQPRQYGVSHTVENNYYLILSDPEGNPVLPSRVRVRVRVQPVAREVLDSLVKSKDLEAAIAKSIQTITLAGSVTEWEKEDGFGRCITMAEPNALDCPNDYLCPLYPDRPGCE